MTNLLKWNHRLIASQVLYLQLLDKVNIART